MAINADVISSLDRYVKHGVPTGGFLKAVLSNDLLESVSRADSGNLSVLPEIVLYIHNHLPSGCHGSRERVQMWIQKFAICQTAE